VAPGTPEGVGPLAEGSMVCCTILMVPSGL
jgi:hypothetical protein